MMHYVARLGECLTQFERIDSLGGPLILLALLVVGGPASVANATSFSWNALNGQFNDSANWDQKGVIDLDGVPDANDVVTFRRGSIVTYTVTFPGTGHGNGSPVDYVTDQLRVGNNNVSFADGNSTIFPFSLVPSTYTVDNPTTAESGRGIIVGETAADTTAVLTTRLATLSAVAATIGDAAGSNGTLNVNAGTFNVTGSGPPSEELIVGRNGIGTITANGGDVSVAGTTWLGLNAGSHGTVNISNANSTWTSGGLIVGNLGDGTLNVTSGGTLNTGSADIHGSATVATVTGANSTWTNSGLTMERGGTLNISDGGSVGTGQFLVGFSGNGTVNVTSGGQLITSNAQLGGFSGNSGYADVTVAGADSGWSNFGGAGGAMVIGYDNSPGAINVTDGGHFVHNAPGFVNISGTGNVSVEGAGSSWTAPTTSVIGMMTVSNGGTVNSEEVDVVGILKGNGSIAGNVFNEGGIVAPGNSLGALHITGVGISGGYTQYSTGKLQIELGGTTPDSGYDQLLVAGNITLDGTLQVSLVSPFSPAFGDSFKILDWSGTLTGQFASVQLPTLSGPLGWDLKQLYTTGALSVILVGDFNGNGIVDAADYVVWRKGLGTAYTPNDYNVWRSHFGQSAGSGTSATVNAAVPEPATSVLLMFAAAGWCLWRARNAWRVSKLIGK